MSSWIKIRSHLANHPKVLRISCALKVHPSRVLGCLVYIWSVADMHADGECLPHMTTEVLDQMVDLPGLSDQLIRVEWMRVQDDGLYLPNYQEHNGANAKRRALEAKRKGSVREASASDADNMRTKCGHDADVRRNECGHDAELDKSKSKRKKKNKDKETKNSPSSPQRGDAYDPLTAPLPLQLDTEEFRKAWLRWWLYRRERHLAPYKASTIQARLNLFVEMGEKAAISAISTSIANNWAGLFEPRSQTLTHTPKVSQAHIPVSQAVGLPPEFFGLPPKVESVVTNG